MILQPKNTIQQRDGNDLKNEGRLKRLKNLEKGTWKKGQSGNPAGPKPKTFAGLAKQLRDLGYKEVTKEMIKEAFQLLIGSDREMLAKLMSDIKQPIAITIVAKRLLDDDADYMLEKVLDRAHGKAPITMGDKENQTIGTLAAGLIELGRVGQKSEH